MIVTDMYFSDMLWLYTEHKKKHNIFSLILVKFYTK